FDVTVDQRQVQFVGTFEERRVQCGAADDEHAWFGGKRSEELPGIPVALHSRNRVGSQDDVAAVGKRFADRCPCTPSHDDRMAGGETLEALQVLRDVPWERPRHPDGPVTGDRRDEGEGHTATSNLIGSSGSYPVSTKSSKVSSLSGFGAISSRGSGRG